MFYTVAKTVKPSKNSNRGFGAVRDTIEIRSKPATADIETSAGIVAETCIGSFRSVEEARASIVRDNPRAEMTTRPVLVEDEIEHVSQPVRQTLRDGEVVLIHETWRLRQAADPQWVEDMLQVHAVPEFGHDIEDIIDDIRLDAEHECVDISAYDIRALVEARLAA